MARKQAEAGLVALANNGGFFRHKYRDVSYCIKCRTPQPKTERMVDYVLAPNNLVAYVEVKDGGKDGRFNFSDISELQRVTLDTNEQRAWLFLQLGTGRWPKGKWAYLIPWLAWRIIEDQLLDRGQKSITQDSNRNAGADEMLSLWQLEYETGTGLLIPADHAFWRWLHSWALDTANEIERNHLTQLETTPW